MPGPFAAFIRVLLVLPLLLSGALPLAAAEIKVPSDVITIQDAIDIAADGDTVLVADGSYTGKGFFNISFKGKAITVTSENGPEVCIIDCNNEGRGFIFENGEGPGSVLNGFTIQSGKAHHGGAVYCYYASPTISNNILYFNTAVYRGGAIHCYESSPVIEWNVISSNLAGWAGGINCYRSSPSIRNNQVTFNTASQGEGGGLRFDDSASVLVNNLVAGNIAFTWGGGSPAARQGCRSATAPSPRIRPPITAAASAAWSRPRHPSAVRSSTMTRRPMGPRSACARTTFPPR